jgi:hypothetical protein
MISALMIYTIPFLYHHMTIGWGNLIFSTYLVLAVFYCTIGHATERMSMNFIGGFLLAFAAWTRPEGIGYAVAIAVFFTLVNWARKKQVTIYWTLPILIISASWLSFSFGALRSDEIGDVIGSFWDAIFRGEIAFDQIGHIIQYAFEQWTDTNIWGYLFYSLPLLFIVNIISLGSRLKISTLLVAGGGLISISIPLFMFFVASFSKSNMSTFLWASFNRSQFHGLILLFSSLVLGAFSSLDQSLE